MYSPTTIAAVLAGTLAWALPVTTAQAQVDPRLWGLSMIGVDKAWAQGFDGRGIAVGVMDDAAQVDHPQYADRWQAGFNVDGSPYGPLGSHYHGTHVTGTIAGKNVGVAPGSLIYGINWDIPFQTDISFANGFDWATSQGVRVLNNSWGLTMIDPVSGTKRSETIIDTTRAHFEARYSNSIRALRDGVDADVVYVFATGNSALSQPGVLAGLPHFLPELQSNWIAVTAVGPAGTTASYAQLCGLAAAWCVAAPGGDGAMGTDDAIWSAWPGSLYNSINGTSMAAPHVTGAVAIAAQIFPEASGAELTRLVLQSATDIGDKGIDNVYGWGLLNVGNMVAAIDPATAGLFANAAWSRTMAFAPVDTVLRQRLGAMAGPVQSQGGFTALSYAPVQSAPMPWDETAPAPSGPVIWVAPLYGFASIAAGASSPSARNDLGGLLAGIDLVNDESVQLGLSLGFSQTAMRAGTDRADMSALHLGAYGAVEADGWFINGTAQAALFNQSTERHAISGASGLSFDPVGRASLSGSGLGLSVQLGHEFDLNTGVVLAPYLAAAAGWHSTGAATETGAGAFSLSLPASGHGYVEVGPGLRVEAAPIALEAGTLQLSADLAYARVEGSTSHATSVALLGRTIEGHSAEIGRDVIRLGGKLDLTTDAGGTWFAGYQGAFRQGASAHTLSAGFKARF